MKNYTRKDTRTLEQVAKAVTTMRKQVTKKVAAYEKAQSIFTVVYKLIGSFEEQSYQTSRFESLATLEEYLLEQGTHGKISYYLYGKKGTARADMQQMAFI